MPPNTRFNSSSTLRSIKSNISSQIGSILIGDNTTIPDAPVNESFDGSLTVSELIFQILLQNRNALFDDIRVGGRLSTECLSVDNLISIGDTSGSTFKILQFITKDIHALNSPDQVIADTTYEIIHDISLSFRAKNSNGYYQLSLAFNYLTSTYYNTFLKIGLFYNTTITDLGINSNENLIGEYIIGGENANFTNGLFSKTMFIDISHAANDTINFYLKGKIQTDLYGNDFNYVDLDDMLKPKIIQTLPGNLITAAEFSYFT